MDFLQKITLDNHFFAFGYHLFEFHGIIACVAIRSTVYLSATKANKYKKATIKYLDDFYSVINNPESLQKEFGYPCNKNGTGNVVIKGLREE